VILNKPFNEIEVLQLHCCRCWDQAGTQTREWRLSKTIEITVASCTFATDHRFSHPRRLAVRTLLLDDYIERNRLNVINFLTMELEGRELSILDGFQKHPIVLGSPRGQP
jgi:FkbM family methyltransferase